MQPIGRLTSRLKKFIFLFLLLIPGVIYSQDASLSGYITGVDSTLVSGATIVLKGTTRGTIADNKGFYSFKKITPGIYTLRVSLLGYETQENNGCR